jgi:hypothetical protein
MKTVAWTGATPWEQLMKEAENEDVVVMRDGHAVALVMPFDDDDLDWYSREHDPAFLASLGKPRQQIANGHSRSHQDLKKELSLD